MTIISNNFIGDRNTNEDKYFNKKILKDKIEIFGIFDGHKGDKVAEFCCKYFYSKLKEFFNNFNIKTVFDKKIRVIKEEKEVEYEIYDLETEKNEIVNEVIEDIISKVSETEKKEKKEKEIKFKKIYKKKIFEREEEYEELNIKKCNIIFKKLIQQLFDKCEHKIILNYEKLDAVNCGSTALVGIYFYNNMYVGNVGDTRLTIIDPNFKAQQLTIDHNCKNINEKTRVLSLGGYFNNNYVFNRINLTRSLGDLWQLEKIVSTYYQRVPPLKEWDNYDIKDFNKFQLFLEQFRIKFFISYSPDIYHVEDYKQNIAIISASDGLWSCMNNDYINNIIFNLQIEFQSNKLTLKDKNIKEEFNTKLLEQILDKWNKRGKSIDNITYLINLIK
jgi:serine/threonine protein phosphatase PrpC